MWPKVRAFFRNARVPDVKSRRGSRRFLLCLSLLALLAPLVLTGCGQGVRVQPKGQVVTSIGVGR